MANFPLQPVGGFDIFINRREPVAIRYGLVKFPLTSLGSNSIELAESR
jgi:hypothetical protein